jgi:hypothetical protein
VIKVRSNRIRNAAKGEECTARIWLVCNSDTDTTVYAHLPDETKGMGTKSCDLSGAFLCSSCHDFVDGRVKHDVPKEELEQIMRRAQTRTMRRLVEMGIIKIEGFKP